jgi:hypothetical protein
VRDTRLNAGEKIPAQARGDWYAAMVLDGAAEVAGNRLVRDDVLIVERNQPVPELTAGQDGVELLEFFRTTRGL